MHAVRYTVDGGVFTPHAPETNFVLVGRERYDNHLNMTADGKSFLFATAVDSTAANVRREPTIVLNWAKELDAIVPAE